ncbi:MAG: tetratricopeptide repeat protein [Proteobacteria bacterium]|nr:tetratricopeptide repeat protein [Pseudomonadota bacterium]
MFAFRKKNKNNKELDKLIDLLQKDPENTKNRLKLADHYLRSGDKKSAIQEYQTAASHLSEEGFNLKAIAIYKKVLTLGSTSLGNHKSLAALYTEEGLIAEARRTYEKILHIRPEDEETQAALRELEEPRAPGPSQYGSHILEEEPIQGTGESDPVPIEDLLVPSNVENPPPQSAPPTSEINLEGFDIGDFSDRGQTGGPELSPDGTKDFEMDLGKIQPDELLDIDQPPDEAGTEAKDSLHGTVLRDLTVGDISNDFPSQEIDSHPVSPPPADSPQSTPFNNPQTHVEPSAEDPHLHYHLGVAYREMELPDKAIEEFTKSLDQGTKPLECLIMLARCHFEKGLFQDAADFLHRALKLDNLNQGQIDLLHRQLEEVEAVGKLG